MKFFLHMAHGSIFIHLLVDGDLTRNSFFVNDIPDIKFSAVNNGWVSDHGDFFLDILGRGGGGVDESCFQIRHFYESRCDIRDR